MHQDQPLAAGHRGGVFFVPLTPGSRHGGRRQAGGEPTKHRWPSAQHPRHRKLLAVALALFGPAAYALPVGPAVVSGTASVSQSGNVLTVQNSANAILNWQKFSIAAGELVKFVQPTSSSSVLNRVVGANPSLIYGQLQSNGSVWLINPAGILVGPGARIDTAAFVASSLPVSHADFLAGRMAFEKHGKAAGSVINQGVIATPEGGQVYLLAPEVRNEGRIVTLGGTTVLAAGQKITLLDTATPGVKVEIAGDGRSTNLGSILATAGRIGMAGALLKNAGLLNASSVVSDGGRIFLRATQSIELTPGSALLADGVHGGAIAVRTDNAGGIAGTLLARGVLSAQGDGAAGSGGSIDTAAAQVDLHALDARTRGGEWRIASADFAVADAGGAIGGAQLGQALHSGNVGIATVHGDIEVNAAVEWDGASTLTLDAARNIAIHQRLSATDANGKLALRYGQAAPAADNTATYRIAAPVNLRAGKNFSTRLGSDGATVVYTVVTALGQADSRNDGSLQGMRGDPSGNYALGADIEASVTAEWNPRTEYGEPNAGFLPIGDAAQPYSGRFDGLGHTVVNLTTTSRRFSSRPELDPVDVGLFGYSTGRLANLALVGGSTSGTGTAGYVGALVGYNLGEITNVRTDKTVAYRSIAGGIAGYNGGVISDAHAGGSTYGLHGAGGVAGVNEGTLTGVAAAGFVNSQEDDANSGGLAGMNTGTIRNSHSSADVLSYRDAGGLVAINSGLIESSYATGDVDGYRRSSGGLVGVNSGTLITVYATGNVTGSRRYNGGLVGLNDGGSIDTAYASGAVNGVSAAGASEYNGGLVAYNAGSIRNAYATGAVRGAESFSNGGLAGFNAGSIDMTYASGTVSDGVTRGGLAGGNAGTITRSYWNMDSSGQTSSYGGSGLSNAQMMQMASFVGWDIARTGGSGATWRIYEGHTAPLLTAFLTPLVLCTAPDRTVAYNGRVQSGGSASVAGLLGAPASGTTVGFYNGYYSTQQGFDLIGGNLSIVPAPGACHPGKAASVRPPGKSGGPWGPLAATTR